jgi:hypothetical protein
MTENKLKYKNYSSTIIRTFFFISCNGLVNHLTNERWIGQSSLLSGTNIMTTTNDNFELEYISILCTSVKIRDFSDVENNYMTEPFH